MKIKQILLVKYIFSFVIIYLIIELKDNASPQHNIALTHYHKTNTSTKLRLKFLMSRLYFRGGERVAGLELIPAILFIKLSPVLHLINK